MLLESDFKIGTIAVGIYLIIKIIYLLVHRYRFIAKYMYLLILGCNILLKKEVGKHVGGVGTYSYVVTYIFRYVLYKF